MTKLNLTGLLAMTFFISALIGCNDTAAPTTDSSAAESSTTAVVDDPDGHSRGGWWCVEHGVPEGECALCDTSLVAAFKADGDWCKEHNRPESQCFLCEPSRFETFAARYEAKYGEQPPQPTE